MAIQITANPKSHPAVVYDRVHMTSLSIKQPVFDDDAQTPHYEVEVYYRLYGVVDQTRYYKHEEVQRVFIDDFIALATEDAMAGDPTLVNALSSIEEAVAAILADQVGLAAEKV